MVQGWFFETEKVRCSLYEGEEGAVHVVLKCFQRRK
jgi:hypothetical protein